MIVSQWFGWLHAKLTAAARSATGDAGAATTQITRALVASLTALATQIQALSARIAEQLTVHADAQIFLSLPARVAGTGLRSYRGDLARPRTHR
jgi:hypothetical protein